MSKVPYRKSIGLSSLEIDYPKLIELQSRGDYSKTNIQKRPYKKVKTKNSRVVRNPRNYGGNVHD